MHRPLRRSRSGSDSAATRAPDRSDPMTDLIFLLVTAVFFAISVAYTRGLDRI
jgi:hypothetical protein